MAAALAKMSSGMLIGFVALAGFNLTDTYFVAQLGTNELAAMSFTFPVAMLIGGFAIGIGRGDAKGKANVYDTAAAAAVADAAENAIFCTQLNARPACLVDSPMLRTPLPLLPTATLGEDVAPVEIRLVWEAGRRARYYVVDVRKRLNAWD